MSNMRKIKKNAQKFSEAMAAVEKQIEEIQGSKEMGDTSFNSFKKFDLVSVVVNDALMAEKEKKAKRNKRKSDKKR